MIGYFFTFCIFFAAVVADVSHLGVSNLGYSYNAPSTQFDYPSNEYIPPISPAQQQEYLAPAHAHVEPIQPEYLPPVGVQQESYQAPAPQVHHHEYSSLPQQEYISPPSNQYIPPSSSETYESGADGYQYNVPLRRFRS